MAASSLKISKDQELNLQISELLRSTCFKLDNKEGKTISELSLVANLEKVRDIISEFETSSKLLDEYLSDHVNGLTQIYLRTQPGSHLASAASSCVYQLCIVRGYKPIMSYLSTDVQYGSRLVANIQTQNVGQFEAHFLLLWLSSFAMVPFPLDNVLPGLHASLYDISLRFLAKYGGASRTQKMGAVLLSRLLVRSDSRKLLSEYLEGCCEHWSQWTHAEKLGHLMVIKQTLKHSSNDTLSEFCHKIHEEMVLPDLSLIRYGLDTSIPNTNVLLLMGILSKVASFYVLETNYLKVSGIVNNFLNDILTPLAGRFEIKLREVLAKNLGELVSILKTRATNYASQLVWYITRQLHVPELEFKPSGYIANVTIDPSNLSVAKLHTTLLFYGFLGLNRSLDRDFVPVLLSVTHKTLFLSSIHSPLIQGSQIRDASCFCLWALLRHLTSDEFGQLRSDKVLTHDLWADILRVLLLDEDYTIRRCAVPVLQEFIGRFGTQLSATLTNHNASVAQRLVERTALLVDSDNSTLSAQDMIDCGYPSYLFLSTILDTLMASNVSFSHYYRCSNLFAEFVLAESHSPDAPHAFEVSDVNQPCDILLLQGYHSGNIDCLIPLGSLLRIGKLDPTISSQIVLDGKSINSHHVQFRQKAAYLFWCSSCIIADHERESHGDLFWSLWISIVSNESSCKGEYKKLIDTCMEATKGQTMKEEVFHSVLKRLRHGISLIASQMPWEILSETQLRETLVLLADKKVDAETRASLINRNERLLNDDGSYRPDFPLLDLLDDYTTTEKGDVGSKIRLACLQHCKEYLGEQALASALEAKVVRLAGESIDSVRAAAFALLVRGKEDSDSTFIYDEYYHDFFGIYGGLSDISREAFWEGVVHSVAGVKASKAVVNSSFRQLLFLIETLTEEEKNEAFAILLRQLKLPKPFAQLDTRTQKTILATLNLFVKLFEASVALPATFNFNALFVRAYNLQLNAAGIRFVLTIGVFQHLSVIPSEVTQKARQRLCQVHFQAKSPHVRRSTGDALFEIINELSPASHSLLTLIQSDTKPSPKHYKDLEHQLLCI